MVLAIVILILSLDQLTKLLVTQSFVLYQSKAVIPGIFHLTLIHNKGAAFGILKNQLLLFIATSVLAILMICSALRDKTPPKSKLYISSLTLILAGALGNLIDRLFFGDVIDFLDFRIWPVFNVADSAITVGAILLGIQLLKPEKK